MTTPHVSPTDTNGGGVCTLHGTDHSHGEGSSCCRKCGVAWTGHARNHCPTCHETFGGVGGFDMHRRDGRCVDPATVRLHQSRGYWLRSYG